MFPRSILYIPANQEKFLAKASQRGADVIALDLEDAVAPDDKQTARKAIPALINQYLASSEVWVRVNRPWRLLVRDLETLVCSEIRAIIIPKTDCAERIRFIDEMITELEREKGLPHGHTRLIGFIESIDGLYQAREIARASQRLAGLGMGTEDLALEMGMQNTPETLSGPCQQLIMAARGAGIQPIGLAGSMAEFRDMDKYQRQLQLGYQLGFQSAFCIHPLQVAEVNRIYQPNQTLIAWAEQVIDIADTTGNTVFEVEGKMVDLPVIEKARGLLAGLK
ncbi:HpcH/HpaI aldolase/citrate lyase family protein [Oceanospirillum sediminis]|uniref:CoA ester lyase n=1 Tax=Oceanospirillum sediminis TaxID=2760088 RepID=A0A839IU01_9GAMM|nr:CoA ester lyase [Oceanospirillum sediminis]MBB1488160.1 CoA ester lyase [Oceanospirillum sediminis]